MAGDWKPPLRSRLGDLAAGLRYRYPLCCVLAYAFDPRSRKAERRGVIDHGYGRDGRTLRYVPCPLHVGSTGWRPIR